MKQLSRMKAIFAVAIKRSLAQPLLSLATIVGLTVAIALVLTIPMYSESVAFRILSERLSSGTEGVTRPPFAYMFTYIGSWHDPVDWEDTDALDTFLREEGGIELGLPISQLTRHFETYNFRLLPSDETNYTDDTRSLGLVAFATTEGIFDQVDIIEGSYPVASNSSTDTIVEVMIHETFASQLGIHAGETYLAYDWRLEADHALQVTTIRIAGIWRPINEDSPFWFYNMSAFEDLLLVHESTFKNSIATYTNEEIYLGLWYLVADGSTVNTSRVNDLITRHDETLKIADQLLPGTLIQVSPIRQLKPYQRIVEVLTVTLTVFSIPIVVLLVLFLIMIVNLIVDRQRNETAVLRSRGIPPLQVIGLAIVEAILMGFYCPYHWFYAGNLFYKTDRFHPQFYGLCIQ